jgi:hypothetical protein
MLRLLSSVADEPRGSCGRSVLLAAGALPLAVALSVSQGIRQQVGQDFHVFWQAGRNFATGLPLYHDYLPGARQFKYPPFAAFVFQPLAVFPLPVAATLFSLFNLALWVAAVHLIRDIVARSFPERNPGPVPLVLAVAFSAQFFLDNFHHVQMNGVIFVLVLLGIDAYLREKDVRAAAYLVTATAIKITPIFFLAWLLIRGRRRAAVAVLPLALGCVLVPLLVRGPATGSTELGEYYHSFLEGHQHGTISTYTAGHNLAALVSRMTVQTENAEPVSYTYLPLSEPIAQRIYAILWASVLLAFLAMLVLLRIRRAALSAFELSVIFLASLLLSPITFTTHLVSLLFVFFTFLSVRLPTLSRGGYLVAVVLFVAMVVTGLSGRDLVGRTAYLYVRGYGFFIWTMLLLFLTAIVLARSGRPLNSCRQVPP